MPAPPSYIGPILNTVGALPASMFVRRFGLVPSIRLCAGPSLSEKGVLGWPKRCKLAHAFLW